MSETEALLAAILAARRPIEFTAIATKAANTLAPSQLAELYHAMDLPVYATKRSAFKAAALYWPRFYGRAFLRSRSPRVFRNSKLSSGLRFFEDLSAPVSDKSLLILVSGYGGRLFVPVSLFLDCLPARAMDVVFLSANGRNHYRHGVVGSGDNLLAVAASLRERFAISEYSRLDVLGTSGGGFAALRLANMLQADNGVAVGGNYPFDMLRLGGLAAAKISAFDPLCSCVAPKAKRLICAFAPGSQVDASNAHNAAISCPSIKLYPVEGQTGHAFLHILYRNRQLERFLELMLSDIKNPPALSRIGYLVQGLLPRR